MFKLIQITAFAGFAVGMCLFAYGVLNAGAMELCQAKGFSYDTCFHSIHR